MSIIMAQGTIGALGNASGGTGGQLAAIGSISFHYPSSNTSANYRKGAFEAAIGDLAQRKDILKERIWPNGPVPFSTSKFDPRRPGANDTWRRWPVPERHERYWTVSYDTPHILT
jgi:hypothetical protein